MAVLNCLITGYDVFQVEESALSKFPNLVGLVRNTDDSQVVPPITLDAGESKTIKMNLGFIAESKVLDLLYELHSKSGAFTLNESFRYLARHGMTIYGGNAEFSEKNGGTLISVDPEFHQHEPVYRVEFKTGRKESFYILGSETMSKFSN